MASNVIICGAGLCGTLLALQLANRGHHVTLVEKRGDLRKEKMDAGRSINLALSDRGLAALDLVGLRNAALGISIPMKGRRVHPKGSSETSLMPYSGRESEFIQSISRPGLNALLLDQAGNHPNIELHFHTQVLHVDPMEAVVSCHHDLSNETFQLTGDVVFGTDGAGSKVRETISEYASDDFVVEQQFMEHGYKELEIPPGPDGNWQIDKNALHIWPRQSYMLIALPNLDGSFTVTLFLTVNGTPGFNNLQSSEAVDSFFNEEFPDVKKLMPELSEDFAKHPMGMLGSVSCKPWTVGKVLLMGDAAHAMVPFYGQGMNCAMEDVLRFNEALSFANENWEEAFHLFENSRRENTDAITQLAVENYFEMRDHVDNPDFITKRKIEMALESTYPDYASKYNLVTFCEHVPYAEAKRKGKLQDKWLMEYCGLNKSPDLSNENLVSLYKELITL